ncbi:MAG: phosphoribosylanthranilate isomerase [Thermoplasmataceae archaeon]
MPAVKICGIKYYEDAEMIARYDPDMLGVILDPRVQRSGNEDLVKKMGGIGIPVVGVYTDQDAVKHSSLYEDVVQLHFSHGEEIVEYVHSTGRKVISVVNYDTGHDTVLAVKSRIKKGADLVLVERRDGIAEVVPDLRLLLQSVKTGLSGKISAANVRNILELGPAFIDLSSSLESSVGRKDPDMVKSFFEELHEDG